MSQGTDITKKIKETKRQTEELKTQLQNLIDGGKQLICPSHSKENILTNDEEKHDERPYSLNNVQIMKSYNQHSNIQKSNQSKNIPTEKTEVKQDSPIKTKPYDVKEAREYMKKQKEQKRLEQTRSQSQSKIQSEIQKKKLEELNKKSRELLAKNLQKQRERSKSRDRSNYIRTDDSTNFRPNLRKAYSVDRLDHASTDQQQNPNVLYPPKQQIGRRNAQSTSPRKADNVEKDNPGKLVILSRNFTRQGTREKTAKTKPLVPNISKNKFNADLDKNITIKPHLDSNRQVNNITEQKECIPKQQEVNIDKLNSPEKYEGNILKTDEGNVIKENNPESQPGSIQNLGVGTHKLIKPRILFTAYEEDEIDVPHSAKSNVDSIKNILEYKSSNSKSLILISPDFEKNEKVEEKKRSPVLSTLMEVTPIDKLKAALPTKTCSVEIQTERENTAYPQWLAEKPPKAYPFNFINTLKRKLDANAMVKATTDVGVQSSVIQPLAQRELSKNSENSKSINRSDLKSFISHKCLNLDPKTIEHLELVPQNNYNKGTNVVLRKLQTQTSPKLTETESESDTSKNIPEISSESGTSLKKNAESVKKVLMLNQNPIINTEKIDNMKLVHHQIASITTTIRTEPERISEELSKQSELKQTTNTLSVESKQYASDFESDDESLEKRRRSIKKFNKSGYDQVLMPSPEFLKSSNPSQFPISGSEKYASDFDSNDDSTESLEKRRRSIKKFNKSGYDQVLIPSPEFLKSNNPSQFPISGSEIVGNTRGHSPKTVEECRKENITSRSSKNLNEIALRNADLQLPIQKAAPSITISEFISKSVDSDQKNDTGSKDKSEINTFPTNTADKLVSSNKNSLDRINQSFGATSTSFSKSESNMQNISTKRGSGVNRDTISSDNHFIQPRPYEKKRSKSSKHSSVLKESRTTGSEVISLSKSDMSLSRINTLRGSSSMSETDKSDILIRSEPTKGDQTKSSRKLSSVNTESRLTKSDMSLQRINTTRGSSPLRETEKPNIPPLIEPTVSLVQVPKDRASQNNGSTKELVKNVSVRSSKITIPSSNDKNQIHLKFEAEIHLLNDFNESLRRFSALEQALETLKSKNTITTSKLLENKDAQAGSSSKITENIVQSNSSQSHTSRINFSRESLINTSLDDLDLITNCILDPHIDSNVSTGLELSNLHSLNQSLSVKSADHLSNFENLQSVNVAGISLNMFEQLIKDEDTRLENLKTILKIREQALLDRTKGELAWLEIQRKHFRETGKLHEASVIKKKQRGILVNHQKEKHEMQRLKQMQKAASIERKIVLKEQRNVIRQQLSTDNMLTKMKLNTPREKRLSGPLKVLQNHTESIRSETSISRKSSSEREKDVLSITSHHSVVSEISEIEFTSKEYPSVEHQKYIKKTLLMREAALKKRRKAAEELLQWHKKLLEEEKNIAILESTASAIISQKPNTSTATDKFNFKGKQLNQLWFNLTGSEGKKFVDDTIYPMSQLSLERFCKSAREYSHKTRILLKKNSDNDIRSSDVSVSENIPTQNISSEIILSEKEYVSDFDNESIPAEEVDVVDQSIDILINNFNKIQDDISTLSFIQTQKSDDTSSDDILSDKLDKSESEAEISVIETNRDPEKHSDMSKSSAKKGKKKSITESIHTVEHDRIVESRCTISREESSKSKLALQFSSVIEDVVNRDPEKNSDKSKSSVLSEISLKTDSSSSKKGKKSSFNEALPTVEHNRTDESRSEILREESSKSKSSSDKSPVKSKNLILSGKHDQSILSSGKSRDANTENIEEIKSSKEPSIGVHQASQECKSDESCVNVSKPKADSVVTGEEVIINLNDNSYGKSQIIDEQIEDTIHKSCERLEQSNVPEESVKLILASEITPSDHKSQTKLSTQETINDALSTIPSDSTSSPRSSIEDDKCEESLKEAISEKDSLEVAEDKSQDKDLPPIATETKESLNESQAILEILGESELRTSSDEEMPEKQIKDSLTASLEILSKLNILDDESQSKPTDNVEKDLQSEEKGDLYKIQQEANNDEKDAETEANDDLHSRSMDQLYEISKSGKDNSDASKISESEVLRDISLLESSNESTKDEEISENVSSKLKINELDSENFEDLIETRVDDTAEELEQNSKLSTHSIANEDISENDIDELKAKAPEKEFVIEECVEESPKTSEKINLPFEIDENDENQIFLNNLVASAVEINVQAEKQEESDDSKLTLSDKSNDSFVINEIADDSNEKLERNLHSTQTESDLQTNKDLVLVPDVLEEQETPRDKTEEYSSVMENVSASDTTTSHFSYGILERTPEKDTSDSFESDVPPSKEEVNSFEEKEHDSLSSANGGSSSEALNLEEQSVAASEVSKSKNSCEEDNVECKDKHSGEVSSKEISVDVKKRVSEIMADTNVSRGDKSPRMQDLYVTTYDLISPANSPEKEPCSPVQEQKLVSSIFDSEAEEILRKQLAVEEEIKAITEQQQKEQQLPLMYLREIPNKPPPPYTPPSSLVTASVPTVIPTSEEIEEITKYSAKILHKAYLSNNLANVNISNNTLSLISKDISKDCYKFVFDLCKDIARQHYKQFEEDNSPTWLRVVKKPDLTLIKPFDTQSLKNHLIKKLKEVFGYQKSSKRENTIIKWSRKKRDHVDEILVMECQQEEFQWTNYQKDELLVKDQITNEILDSLLEDTAAVLHKIFLKRS